MAAAKKKSDLTVYALVWFLMFSLGAYNALTWEHEMLAALVGFLVYFNVTFSVLYVLLLGVVLLGVSVDTDRARVQKTFEGLTILQPNPNYLLILAMKAGSAWMIWLAGHQVAAVLAAASLILVRITVPAIRRECLKKINVVS